MGLSVDGKAITPWEGSWAYLTEKDREHGPNYSKGWYDHCTRKPLNPDAVSDYKQGWLDREKAVTTPGTVFYLRFGRKR